MNSNFPDCMSCYFKGTSVNILLRIFVGLKKMKQRTVRLRDLMLPATKEKPSIFKNEFNFVYRGLVKSKMACLQLICYELDPCVRQKHLIYCFVSFSLPLVDECILLKVK